MLEAAYYTQTLSKNPRDFRSYIDAKDPVNEGIMYAMKDMDGTKWEREWKNMFYQFVENHIKVSVLGKAAFMTGIEICKEAGIKPKEWFYELKKCGMWISYYRYSQWIRDDMGAVMCSNFEVSLLFSIAKSLNMTIGELLIQIQPLLDFYERIVNGIIAGEDVAQTPVQEYEFKYLKDEHANYCKVVFMTQAIKQVYAEKQKWKPTDEKPRKIVEQVNLQKKGILFTSKYLGKL